MQTFFYKYIKYTKFFIHSHTPNSEQHLFIVAQFFLHSL